MVTPENHKIPPGKVLMSEAADFIPVDKVRAIQNMQKGAGNLRDALLWTAGPNWALRVSDLLAVRVGDVRGPTGIRKAFAVKQQKTSKTVTCDITPKIRKAIEAYLLNGHPEPGNSDAPLFPSRNRDANSGDLKPLDRRQAWKIIKRDTEAVGMTGGVYSPHSWRKTWGRAALDGCVPMAVVQEKLGHRTPGSLLTYLGITKDDVRKASIQIEV